MGGISVLDIDSSVPLERGPQGPFNAATYPTWAPFVFSGWGHVILFSWKWLGRTKVAAKRSRQKNVTKAQVGLLVLGQRTLPPNFNRVKPRRGKSGEKNGERF